MMFFPDFIVLVVLLNWPRRTPHPVALAAQKSHVGCCLFVCLFVCLFCLFVCLFVCLFFVCLFVCSFCLFVCLFVPTLGVGLFDFKLNSSPRPAYFSSLVLLLLARSTAQFQSVPGVLAPNHQQSVPNPRVSLECPTPKCPLERQTPDCSRSAQPQSVPGVQPQSVSRVGRPTPECPWSPTPENLYPERVGMFEVKEFVCFRSFVFVRLFWFWFVFVCLWTCDISFPEHVLHPCLFLAEAMPV